MNSSDFFYLYLYLINLKTINSSKSFTFLRSLGIPTKTNNKINNESFCFKESKAATFINYKAKAEPGQTKAREAYALLAFSGLRKTSESTNYRVGAKVSGLFGLSTDNSTFNSDFFGFAPLSYCATSGDNPLFSLSKAKRGAFGLPCRTAQVSGRLSALTCLKKYIKLASFAGEITDKDLLRRELPLNHKICPSLGALQKNNSLLTSFTFLASSRLQNTGSTLGMNSSPQVVGLNQQVSENITSIFNQRILNQSFKQNFASHLKNCEKSNYKKAEINTQKPKIVKLTHKKQLATFIAHNNINLDKSEGRHSYQLNLTTSAPLIDLFVWNNKVNIATPSYPGLNTAFSDSGHYLYQNVGSKKPFLATEGVKNNLYEQNKKAAISLNKRVAVVEVEVVAKQPQPQLQPRSSERASERRPPQLQLQQICPDPFFSTISKQYFLKKDKAPNKKPRYNSFFARFVQKSLLYTKNKIALTKYSDFTKILQNLPAPHFLSFAPTCCLVVKPELKRLKKNSLLNKKVQNTILKSILLGLLFQQTNVSKKYVEKIDSLGTGAAALAKFYTASWFLEYIRNELSLRNANIKRVLNQAFLLTQQPFIFEQKKNNFFEEAEAAKSLKSYPKKGLILTSCSNKSSFSEARATTTIPLYQKQLKNQVKKLIRSKRKVPLDGFKAVNSISQNALFKSLFSKTSLFERQSQQQLSTIALSDPKAAVVATRRLQPFATKKIIGAGLSLKKTLDSKLLQKKYKKIFSLKDRFLSTTELDKFKLLKSTTDPVVRKATRKQQIFPTFVPMDADTKGKSYSQSDQTVIPYLIKGLKITFSGRTGGKKGMAKTLTKTVGRVPLSTLREKIDFAKGTVQTKVGSLGIKVWICYN